MLVVVSAAHALSELLLLAGVSLAAANGASTDSVVSRERALFSAVIGVLKDSSAVTPSVDPTLLAPEATFHTMKDTSMEHARAQHLKSERLDVLVRSGLGTVEVDGATACAGVFAAGVPGAQLGCPATPEHWVLVGLSRPSRGDAANDRLIRVLLLRRMPNGSVLEVWDYSFRMGLSGWEFRRRELIARRE